MVASGQPWHWSEDAFVPASFCVLALLQDGLYVPPFDRHPDGDGTFRALGLDADSWLGWVRAVVEAHAGLAAFFAEVAGQRGGSRPEIPAVIHSPAQLCPGDGPLRRALHEAWVSRQTELEAWQRSINSQERAKRRTGSPRDARRRWLSVSAFGDRLPAFSVLLVDYPEPAVMTVPSATCLIAPEAEADAYTRQLVDAATSLVATS